MAATSAPTSPPDFLPFAVCTSTTNSAANLSAYDKLPNCCISRRLTAAQRAHVLDQTRTDIMHACRMPAPRKEFPASMLAPVTAAELGLPEKKGYQVLRCCNEHGQACARCAMPVVRRTALRHLRDGTLPSCPAHKKGEAGWVYLEQCLLHLDLAECFVHQLPVYSEGHQGRLRNGQLCTQATLKADVVLPSKPSSRYIGVGLELNGSEHRKVQAECQDVRRMLAAREHGQVLIEPLWLGEEKYWLHDIRDTWRAAHVGVAPETCLGRRGP